MDRLTATEICLFSILVLLILFMFSWLFVGSSIVFHNTECKSRNAYKDSYELWAVSMAIIIFWICIIFIVLMILLNYALIGCGFYEGFSFDIHKFCFCILLAISHLILFEIEVILNKAFLGLHFLTYENDCPSKELYYNLSSWLIAWIVTSFLSLFCIPFTIVTMRGSSGVESFTKFISVILIAGHLCMIFLGGAYFFQNFDLSTNDSNAY